MSQEENSFNDQVLTKLQICFSVTQETALDAGSNAYIRNEILHKLNECYFRKYVSHEDKIAFRLGYSLKNVDDLYPFASREFQMKFDHCADMK